MSHETDHEFRLRMAVEGRAIYVPGKTIEEIAAERAQAEERRTQQTARIVTLTFTETAAEIAAHFPPNRRIGKSAIHAWWQRRCKAR